MMSDPIEGGPLKNGKKGVCVRERERDKQSMLVVIISDRFGEGISTF